MKVKLTKATGGEIVTASKEGTVKTPLHSLFQSVPLKIADKLVTESNNLFPYRGLLETLLNYEADVLKSVSSERV